MSLIWKIINILLPYQTLDIYRDYVDVVGKRVFFGENKISHRIQLAHLVMFAFAIGQLILWRISLDETTRVWLVDSGHLLVGVNSFSPCLASLSLMSNNFLYVIFNKVTPKFLVALDGILNSQRFVGAGSLLDGIEYRGYSGATLFKLISLAVLNLFKQFAISMGNF